MNPMSPVNPMMKKKARKELAWIAAISLLCLVGVTLAVPPVPDIKGTWDCDMYISRNESGSQPFTTPTACAQWGAFVGTSGSVVCEGIQTLFFPVQQPPTPPVCPSGFIPVHDEWRYDVKLSFDDAFNVTNTHVFENEKVDDGHVLFSGMNFTSTGSHPAGDRTTNSFFRTTNQTTGVRKYYALARKATPGTADSAWTDGCISIDMREFSNRKMGAYDTGGTGGADQYFFHCTKFSNDATSSDTTKSGGGCFLSR